MIQDRTDSDWAFAAYQSVRPALPQTRFGNLAAHEDDLGALEDRFDVFLLDAFGVLNIGETAIAGAQERVAALQAAGKRVMVVTNAAGYPKRLLMQRYARLGFTFAPEDVVSSRDTLLAALTKKQPRHWGVMASTRFGAEELEELNLSFLEKDPRVYDEVEGFLFFGSSDWGEEKQDLLEASLRRAPRPLLVGNPDLVAPRETGLSREPGHYAHRLAEIPGVTPVFFGKPFANVYELAFARLPQDIRRSRVLMVGDTLHTDILGGRVAGVKTALVTQYGSLRGVEVAKAISQSGIVPDFILPRP